RRGPPLELCFADRGDARRERDRRVLRGRQAGEQSPQLLLLVSADRGRDDRPRTAPADRAGRLAGEAYELVAGQPRADPGAPRLRANLASLVPDVPPTD